MSFTLIVSNLPETTTESNLQAHFSRAGFSIIISINAFSNNSKNGVAFIEMASKEEGERAISILNGGEFCGAPISVIEANQRRRGVYDKAEAEFADKSNASFFSDRSGHR
jgi:RNA recognition motif-containing protein